MILSTAQIQNQTDRFADEKKNLFFATSSNAGFQGEFVNNRV